MLEELNTPQDLPSEHMGSGKENSCFLQCFSGASTDKILAWCQLAKGSVLRGPDPHSPGRNGG